MTAPEKQELGWETKSSVREFHGDHVSVVSEEVRTPARPEGTKWTTVHRKLAVVVAAMTRDGKFLLLHEERIPIRRTLWGMPAGQVDEENATSEMIEETARRELVEETGYQLAKDGELIALGDFFASPGFTDERQFLFLARPVEHVPGAKRHDAESIVDCRAFSPAQLQRMIASGEIRDANTLSIFARLAARGLIELERS